MPVMIVKQAAACGAAEWIWDLRPNRSLGPRQVAAFFAIMCGTSAAVSGYSFSQGNVYAPLFALAELAVLALCLRLVWRQSSVRERLHLTAQALVVEAKGTQSRFHPVWVRLRREEGGQVRLGSHGREIEVGAFLHAQERDELAASVRQALAELKR
jgi:uncharacterized membrane protein